jgi:hypothetical protein
MLGTLLASCLPGPAAACLARAIVLAESECIVLCRSREV